MSYLIWIPLLIVIHFISAKLSITNQTGDNKAAFIIWLLGCLPLWVFVSRVSKNIIFDALLFDFLIAVIYVATFVFFSHKPLTSFNYFGIVFVLVGLILIKI
jgi:uncharacterized membrane protein